MICEHCKLERGNRLPKMTARGIEQWCMICYCRDDNDIPTAAPEDHSFRDQCAMFAMQMTPAFDSNWPIEKMASAAFDMADAMDAERRKRNEAKA